MDEVWVLEHPHQRKRGLVINNVHHGQLWNQQRLDQQRYEYVHEEGEKEVKMETKRERERKQAIVEKDDQVWTH